MVRFKLFTTSIVVMAFVILTIGTDGLFAQSPDTAWTKTFGGSNSDGGYSVQQTLDGGYIITGYTDSYGAGGADVYLIKTDANGNQTWYKTFGGSNSDRGYSVQQTLDGGYIITGWTGSYGAGYDDVYFIKTDASGNQTWYKTFGGLDYDGGYSVQQTLDGGYIITGYTDSYGAGTENVYLIKTDANGDSIWIKTFGGYRFDGGYSVQQTSDSGYIITGYIDAGYFKVYLIKTDANGDTSWTKTFGGSSDDCGYSVQQTLDGGYIITGETGNYPHNDVYLIKTDANGDSVWTKTFGGDNDDEGRSVQQTSDGGYIITGYTGSYPNSDVYLIKVNPEIYIEEKEPSKSHSLHFVASFNQLEIKYFLPHADWVRIKTYDSFGRVIGNLLDKKQGVGDHVFNWDARVPQGVYFIHLETSQTKQIGKAIIFR